MKKGLALVPCKYGLAMLADNHAAHVSVYADGTVAVTHSGCEIGQGINTKAPPP